MARLSGSPRGYGGRRMLDVRSERAEVPSLAGPIGQRGVAGLDPGGSADEVVGRRAEGALGVACKPPGGRRHGREPVELLEPSVVDGLHVRRRIGDQLAERVAVDLRARAERPVCVCIARSERLSPLGDSPVDQVARSSRLGACSTHLLRCGYNVTSVTVAFVSEVT